MNAPVRPIREGFQADEPKPATQPAAAPASAAAPDAPAQAEQWPIKVPLRHRSIRNDKFEEISELSFREPTGGDINRYGNPVRIDTAGEVIIDERKMTLMMGALSGVLSPLLERMDPRDWNTCAYRLRVFFIPEPWW